MSLDVAGGVLVWLCIRPRGGALCVHKKSWLPRSTNFESHFVLSPVNVNLQPLIGSDGRPAIKSSHSAAITLSEPGFVDGAPETCALPVRFGANVDLCGECQSRA